MVFFIYSFFWHTTVLLHFSKYEYVFFHFRFKKARLLIKHLQAKFSECFVPEQELSHDEAMIKYFGKNGLKQSITNKPIRFGFKVWVLATVSGYVVSFEPYQGKGISVNAEENVRIVGAAAASVLDLLDKLPREKLDLPFHIFGDNFFSSHKLLEVLGEKNIQYTGTIRQDRVKGKPPLTSVDKFKKLPRGHHETVVMADESQIVTRWNDNAAFTLLSSCLGDKPLGTATQYSRTQKKYIEVPQPHVVSQYNKFMFGVDRFDQNNNHLRVTISVKKWYWPVAPGYWTPECRMRGSSTRSLAVSCHCSRSRGRWCAQSGGRRQSSTAGRSSLGPLAPDPVAVTSAMTTLVTSLSAASSAGCAPWRAAA